MRPRISFLSLLALSFVLTPFGSVLAQQPIPASLVEIKTLTSEKQAALRQELKQHAQVLESQATVLRIVSKLVGPAVVNIESERLAETAKARGHMIEESGSGFIIKKENNFYVLTNRHVIKNAPPEEINITLADGRRILPTKVMTDPESDLAIMAISAPNLIHADIGDSDKLDIGDFVLAVGSPFGLNQSVTFGIISATGRRNLSLGDDKSRIRSQDFLQTDAAINPGNSGGPLVNLRGEVIGVNTAIASTSGFNEGVGFAIPSKMFLFVTDQLIETGAVTRAFLGVNLNSKFGPAMAAELGLPRPMGALITAVTPNSPAASADLQPGDVILEFNHQAIDDDSHLVNIVSITEVGKKVPLLIYRDRNAFALEIEVTDRSRFLNQN